MSDGIMKNVKLFFGVFITLIGLLLLLDQWGTPIRLGDFWPIILLIPGLFFWIQWLSKREQTGLIVPGTILVLYSFYFFFNQLTDYHWAGQTSFMFTGAVAGGLLVMHHFSPQKRKGSLIAGWILMGIALVTAASTILSGRLWPILFIAAGIILLYTKNTPAKKTPTHDIKNPHNN
jgi:hypothetical protein